MSKIYIQVSKVFTNHLQEYLRYNNKQETANLIYYNGENVIKITYPYDYYARPKLIDTMNLIDIFKKSHSTNLDEFLDYLYTDIIEI